MGPPVCDGESDQFADAQRTAGFNGAAAAARMRRRGRMRRRARRRVSRDRRCTLLQWRRRTYAAESCRRAATRGRARRVNGAAARMRWRGGARVGRSLERRASMGPPHVCGGESRKRATTYSRDPSLQWVRRTYAAERPSVAPLRRSPIWRLQWVRRTYAAERTRGRLEAQDVREASMGPPHVCGGEDGGSRGQSERSSFNGAAARMRRTAASGPCSNLPDQSLQWGRRTYAAESSRPR